jgi:hypothetical protein
MSVALRPLTYDDLLAMPEDGMRRELIGGELFVAPAPKRSHQDVSANLLLGIAKAHAGHRKWPASGILTGLLINRIDVFARLGS